MSDCDHDAFRVNFQSLCVLSLVIVKRVSANERPRAKQMSSHAPKPIFSRNLANEFVTRALMVLLKKRREVFLLIFLRPDI